MSNNILKFGDKVKDDEDDLMSAALFVDQGKEGEEEGPPQDGMAYLRQVIKERKTCADTVTADIAPAVAARNGASEVGGKVAGPGGLGRDKAPPPPGCCPGVAWQREQVKQFSQVRLQMSRHRALVNQEGGTHEKVPAKENEGLWCHLTVGEQVWREIRKEREGVEPDTGAGLVKGEQPRLGLLLAMPVNVCEQVLEYLVAWMSVTGWRTDFGPWVYAVLSRLEKPLTPDVGSSLRDLARLCSSERCRLVEKAGGCEKENDEADGENKETDEDFAALNLFICLVARYFDQSDLVDTS